MTTEAVFSKLGAMKTTGTLDMMDNIHADPVSYELVLGGNKIHVNSLIGQKINFSYSGNIFCTSCGKKTKKSYSQGHCFPCTLKLAACDLCIMKPETCHFEKGTCREPLWGEANCNQPHIVYLANSSGLKVGITRKVNVPYRWMDQGATQALEILEVKKRLDSGLIEVLFKGLISDKTDWRKMLKGPAESIDLVSIKNDLLNQLRDKIAPYEHKVLDSQVLTFNYPVSRYPEKVTSFGFDKNTEISGVLLGIKGQYLILDTGVLNVRSHTGYEVTLQTEGNP